MKIPGRSHKTEHDNIDNRGRQYLNTVYSLARSARAWRWVSLVMALLVLVMVYLSLKTTGAMPVRLVPYDFAVNKNISSVAKKKADARYLALIASADIGLISNWTPGTIELQYRRFLERCAPELYSQQQVALLRKAQDTSDGIRSQAFFQRQVSVVGQHVVEVTGRLKRWGGNELLDSGPVTYRVEYRFLHGVPYIHSFTREVRKP